MVTPKYTFDSHHACLRLEGHLGARSKKCPDQVGHLVPAIRAAPRKIRAIMEDTPGRQAALVIKVSYEYARQHGSVEGYGRVGATWSLAGSTHAGIG